MAEKKIISAADAKKAKGAAKGSAKSEKETVAKRSATAVEDAAEAPVKKTTRAVKAAVEEEAAAPAHQPKPFEQTPERKKRSTGLRIGAVALWVLAIISEVITLFMLNRSEMTLTIVFLVLDAIFCVVGSLLWKKSNRISPCMSENKLVAFLWNQMGLIVCLIAFIPFGLFLLLKSDQLTPKMKKTLAIVASVLFVGATGASVDWNPVTVEDVQQAQAAAEQSGTDGTVYWTRFGKVYHLDEGCQAFSNSEELIAGSVEEAFEANKHALCKFCEAKYELTPADEADLFPEEEDDQAAA